MASLPQFRYLRQTIYKLKRQWPQAITLYRSLTVDADVQTGEMSQTTLRIQIAKAVVLPTKQARQLKLVDASNFAYGGFFDTSSRIILLDKRDLPPNFELTNNDYFIFAHNRYEIKDIALLEYEECLIVTVERKLGSLPYEIQLLDFKDTLTLNTVVGKTLVRFLSISDILNFSDNVTTNVRNLIVSDNLNLADQARDNFKVVAAGTSLDLSHIVMRV